MLDILFLYKDFAYNYSIISLAQELQKYGVRLEAQKIDTVESARKHLRKCDLLLCYPEFYPGDEFCRKNCVAIVSDADGAWCSPHIHLIKFVKGFIESYAYIPRTLHNQKYYCYNMKLLAEAGFKRTATVPNDYNIETYTEEELSKIHVFCGFGSWERMKDIGNNEIIDLNAPRTNPLFFAGTVEYAGTEIEDHRAKAVQICKDVGGIGVAGRLVQWKEYRETFLNTKAILSPFGWGEACHRDFEALAFGCVLIKPDWSFVESFPDISSKDAPYIPCKLDFSDVPAIIEDMNLHWDKYLPMRVRGLHLAKDALNITKNTSRFMEIVKCLLK